MRTDKSSEMLVKSSIDPAAIYNANGTKTGAIIDSQGYESLTFVLQTGVLTDGTWTTGIFGSAASDMTGEVQLTGNQIIGIDNAEAITDDSVCKREGVNLAATSALYRYYRHKATQAAATTGGFVAGLAILQSPRFSPTSTP